MAELTAVFAGVLWLLKAFKKIINIASVAVAVKGAEPYMLSVLYKRYKCGDKKKIVIRHRHKLIQRIKTP